MSQTHDQNFKNLILDYPLQAIQFFAPQETKEMDGMIKVTPLRQEQLKKKLGDRYRELDTPLMLEWSESQKKALIFLIEEESITSRFSITRLAHYCLDICELYKTTRLVPVVVFLKGGHYQQELRLGSDDHTFLNFHFISCNLSALNASDYLDSDNIVARLNLPLMCYNKTQKVDVYAHAVNGLMTIEASFNQQIKYLDFIEQYADMSEAEQLEYQENYLPKESTEDNQMGLVQFIREEGQHIREEGWQEGRQEGRKEGEAELFLRLVKMKFISLPEQVEKKIKQADSEQLLKWSEKLLSADTIDDVFH